MSGVSKGAGAPRRHPDAASRVYDDEAFIVLPGRGQYKILNGTGTRIWDLIDGQRTLDEIAAVIAEEYDVDHERSRSDVEDFLSDLKANGMLAESEPGKVA